MRNLITFSVLALLLSSCISTSKHQKVMARYVNEANSLKAEADEAYNRVDQLSLDLAERRGANEALYNTQDRLLDRLDVLQMEIDKLKKEANSQEKNLGVKLTMQEGKIKEINNLLETGADRLLLISKEIKEKLPNLSDQQMAIDINRHYLSVNLQEEVVFANGSTSRMRTAGKTALRRINRILRQYPEMMVEVVGHLDNQPVGRKSLNNWQYTALRAVSVVQLLTDDYGMGTNRVIASSKCEYAPRASNTTSAGRKSNRRIELRIFPEQSSLIRELNKILSRPTRLSSSN